MTETTPTQIDAPARAKYHVNEYLMDQAYGGPEEGGWWYTTGRFVACLGTADRLEDAWKMKDEHTARINELNRGLPSITSVISQGRSAIQIDDEPGADFPSERPFYS